MNVSTDPPGRRWQDGVNLLLGLWLFVSPWVWHGTTPSGPTWTNSGPNAWILGGLVLIMALWALVMPAAKMPEWINALAGLWLFVAPWALGFARVTASAAWNQWAVGLIVLLLSVWAASTMSHGRTGGLRAA